MIQFITSIIVVAAIILGCACLVPLGCFWWCIIAGVTFFGTLSLGIAWPLIGHKNTNEQCTALKSITCALLGMAVGALLSFAILGGTFAYCSITKYMTGNWWSNHNLVETIETAMRTPNSATSAEAGDVIIVYKFGCSDCDAIYDDAKAYADELGANVKWVSSDSEFGKQFCSEHGIDWTPTGVYMLNTPIASTEIIQMHLDTTENDQTVLNESALRQLIEYKNSGK